MAPRYDDDWIASMMDLDKRVGARSPEDFLSGCGLNTGDTVVDVGCGPGLFTIAAAKVVGPKGVVYAVETEQKMLDVIDQKATDLGLANVKSCMSAGDRLPLGDAMSDLTIAALVVHFRDGFEARVDMARDISRVTKPDGRVLLIEWTTESAEGGHHRISQQEAPVILREAGLSPGEPEPLGDGQYMILAGRG